MIVTVSNEANLQKAKDLLKARTDSETVELALEIVIQDLEAKQTNFDLPDEFFEDLFSERTLLTDGASVRAVIKDREESN